MAIKFGGDPISESILATDSPSVAAILNPNRQASVEPGSLQPVIASRIHIHPCDSPIHSTFM
jgi:hypothetical protein